MNVKQKIFLLVIALCSLIVIVNFLIYKAFEIICETRNDMINEIYRISDAIYKTHYDYSKFDKQIWQIIYSTIFFCFLVFAFIEISYKIIKEIAKESVINISS